MIGYRRKLQLAEFIRRFRRRYCVGAGDDLARIAMPTDEMALLSEYLYDAIIDWTLAPVNGAGGQPDLGASLEQFTKRNLMAQGLEVVVSEKDLKALGAFVVRGMVDVFLTADRVCVGLKSGESKYAGQ
jgi:hypothetical protein